MTEDRRVTGVDYGQAGHDVEKSRPYSPDVVLWQLTSSGAKRMEDDTLPSLLPHSAYRVMALLRKLEYAEEDEISNHLDLTLSAVRRTLERLQGYGYVQRVQMKEQAQTNPAWRE